MGVEQDRVGDVRGAVVDLDDQFGPFDRGRHRHFPTRSIDRGGRQEFADRVALRRDDFRPALAVRPQLGLTGKGHRVAELFRAFGRAELLVHLDPGGGRRDHAVGALAGFRIEEVHRPERPCFAFCFCGKFEAYPLAEFDRVRGRGGELGRGERIAGDVVVAFPFERQVHRGFFAAADFALDWGGRFDDRAFPVADRDPGGVFAEALLDVRSGQHAGRIGFEPFQLLREFFGQQFARFTGREFGESVLEAFSSAGVLCSTWFAWAASISAGVGARGGTVSEVGASAASPGGVAKAERPEAASRRASRTAKDER